MWEKERARMVGLDMVSSINIPTGRGDLVSFQTVGIARSDGKNGNCR
jgi:hypothetical protein